MRRKTLLQVLGMRYFFLISYYTERMLIERKKDGCSVELNKFMTIGLYMNSSFQYDIRVNVLLIHGNPFHCLQHMKSYAQKYKLSCKNGGDKIQCDGRTPFLTFSATIHISQTHTVYNIWFIDLLIIQLLLCYV